MKQVSPAKLKQYDLFDGDLTEEDSDVVDDVSPIAPSTSYASPTNTHKTTKSQEQPSRPQRSRKMMSYGEDSSEESVSNTPTVATNRKRRREPVKETPNKRSRVDSVNSLSPEVTPTKKQKQTPLKKPASASLPLSTPAFSQKELLPMSPTTRPNKPFYIYLSFEGNPSTQLSTPEGYWWPAKEVTRDDQSTNYIFQIYGNDGKGDSRTFTIEDQTQYERRSMWHPAPPKPRFNQNNFQSSEVIDKGSFIKACSIAVSDDVDEDEDEEEDEENLFPIPGLLDFSKPISLQEAEWSPPDHSSLVGCRVLCRKAGGNRQSPHWPARIKEYIPPKSKIEKPTFVMDFFDWKVEKVTRDCFFTSEDDDRDQFARCNIDYKKLVEIWEEKNTAATIDVEEIDVTQLPEPIIPIPEPIKFVEHLTMEHQFVYIVPFLQRIIDENYPPSQSRIDLWMKGGVSRSAILNNPIQSGNMVEVDYERLGYLLPKNTQVLIQLSRNLTNYTRNLGQMDHSDLYGSRRFQELSAYDRIQFVTDVLLGEAVIQLLLFRAGKRTSLDVLSSEQEAEMHQIGWDLSVEESASRLVRTVMEERQRARRERKLPIETSEKTKRALPTQRAAQRSVAQES